MTGLRSSIGKRRKADMDAVKTFCYLNKDMQFTENKSDAIALAYRFREKCRDGAYCAGSDNQIIEVVFFEPIGHNAILKESNQIVKDWGEKYYPQYKVFLPSTAIFNLDRMIGCHKLKNGWTRSYDDDGYPQYRYYPILWEDRRGVLSRCSSIGENVYVSLVLSPKEFEKLTNIQLLEW